MKKLFFTTLLILILISTLTFAQVQWQDNGVPIRQGENIEWNQTSVACDDGTFVSVWTDTRNGIRGIYAQKIDENGNSLWGGTGLEIYNPDRIQSNPIAISSTNNSIIICWLEHDSIILESTQIRVQKIDLFGNKQWGTDGILIGDNLPYQSLYKIVKHSDGGVYVFWLEQEQSDIKGLRIGADGSIPTGWGDGIDILPFHYLFDVNTDHMDGVILSSLIYDDIYIQRIDENGNKLWGYNGTLLYNGIEWINEMDICSSIADEYYFSWDSYEQNGIHRIMTQKINSSGNSIWNSPIVITEEYASKLFTICPSDSQPIITWINDDTIFSQKIDSEGNMLWGEDGVTVFETNEEMYFFNIILKDDFTNGCILTWEECSTNDTNRILVQRINSNGDLLFGEEGLIIYESSDQFFYPLDPSLVVNYQNYYLCWLAIIDDTYFLIHQIIDENGNIYLEENGEEMYSGACGYVKEIQLLSNEDNPIMLWTDRRNYNEQIYIQKLDSNGSNLLADNGIPLTVSSQYHINDFEAVYDESSDTIALVWYENRMGISQVFAQGIDTDGNLLWADSSGICLTTVDHNSGNPEISIVDNSGNDEYYIGWENFPDIFTPEIYGQKIIDGVKQWGENGIQIAAFEDYSIEIVDVIDRFYIWQKLYYPNAILKIKLIDENGNTAQNWSEDGLEIAYNNIFTDDYFFKLIPTGLLISWFNENDNKIYGQVVDYEGNFLWQDGGLPLIEGEDINNFNIHYNDAIYIVWNKYVEDNYSNYHIQKFSENGEALWQEDGIRISYWTQSGNSDPAIASVEQDVLVVWEHCNLNENVKILAQQVSPSGELEYGLEGITVCDQILVQKDPQVYTNNNDAYICWKDGRSTALDVEFIKSVWGIYAQKIQLEPTLADDELVEPIEILSNYPNPFNPSTTISFSLNTENTENTEINIFNIKGQKVKTFLINPSTDQPINSVIWNGTDENEQPVASGIYLYQLNIDDKVIASKKCLLLK